MISSVTSNVNLARLAGIGTGPSSKSSSLIWATVIISALCNAYRVEHPQDIHLLSMSSFLVDYPFANRLYPESLDVLERFRSWGETVILSDGDVVFQPRKIERSGIFETVEGKVLVYIHKEEALDDVARRYPADHYVAGGRQAADSDRS